MIYHKTFACLIPRAMLSMALVLGPGCGSNQEIPLAKVPPPPPGFGSFEKQKGAPKGASPVDASRYRQ